jgi:hypothetical protein
MKTGHRKQRVEAYSSDARTLIHTGHVQFRVCLSIRASCLSAVQRSRRLSLQYHATRRPIAKAFQFLPAIRISL